MKKLLLVAGIFISALSITAQNRGDIGFDVYGGYTFGDKSIQTLLMLKFKMLFNMELALNSL